LIRVRTRIDSSLETEGHAIKKPSVWPDGGANNNFATLAIGNTTLPCNISGIWGHRKYLHSDNQQ
jgi:hypothetical protein